MRALAVIALCYGCARFVDERPHLDVPDGLGNDFGSNFGGDLLGEDGGADGIIARGTFGGRAGHSGQGTATLARREGALWLEFGDDFAVTGVPGPEVVLTRRDSIGTRIESSDLDLGPLASANGAQTYAIPSDGGRNVFIFCKPFGVEVALAVLAP